MKKIALLFLLIPVSALAETPAKDFGAAVDEYVAFMSRKCTSTAACAEVKRDIQETLKSPGSRWRVATDIGCVYVIGVLRGEPRVMLWSYAEKGVTKDRGIKTVQADSSP